MSLLRRFIRNCSSFFFLLFCFLFFSVSVFASTNISYPVSFSDCATHGASCTDLQTDVSDIDVDGGTEYVSTNWPDDPFTFSGSAWSDNSNPYFVQFNFNPNIDSSDTVLDAKVEYDGIFVPIDCNSNSECRFKFLSSTNGFAAIEEIHNQDNLSLSPVLDLSIPSSQFNLLNSLSLRLLAYGTPSDTSYSGFNSQIDYVKLTATVDEDPPSVPVLEWPIGGAYIDDNTPLMQWADSTDDESGIKNYLYRVYYNCSDSLDIPASCSSLYPDEDGLVRTSSEYQGGSTSDGTYYWQARAVDGTDKMSDWSGLEEVTIDTVSPVVSNLQVDKSLVTAGDIITIEADVVDSSGISAVSADFAYNQTYTSRPSPTSVGMTYISGDTYRVQYTVPTSWNDGDMYIKIAARDNTSRNWMRSVEQEIIEVDSTAPTVSIDAPSAGFVNGQVVINGSVIDDHPHHYWLVIQNDQGQTIAGPGEVGETNSLTDHDFMTWDTNGVVDGNYTIILHARDTLDLKDANSMTEVVVTVDNTGPDSPIIFTPFVEEYFNTTPILATWSEVSDSSGIDYYRIQYEYDDGHTFYHTTPYTNKNHTPGIGEQGGVSFRVQAFDTLGNEGDWSGWRHYYYDATSPSAPGDPFTIPNPTNILTQNWSWTASIDTGGISQYLWRIPGYSNGAVLGTSLETSLGEGSWNLSVKAEDNAGNEGDESESLELVVDTTSPPTPTGLKRMSSDYTAEYLCGEVIQRQIAIPVWDEYLGSDFSHYEYSSFHPSGAQGLNEKILYTATLENSWLAPADGAYGFAVRTVDLAGNKSAWALSDETLEGSCQIIYDSVPPVVTVDSLVINDTTPALSGNVSDEHQIDFLTVTVDGQSSDLAIIHGDGRWTLADDILSPLADGLYNVVVEVIDEAGNVGTDTTLDELRIDSVAPTAVFTHYIDGEEFIGSIAYVNDINRLTFTGVYTDVVPSSGLKQDSFVIFDAQADGSFAFSNHGAKAYCSWRSGANTIPLSGTIDTLTSIPFAYCENPLGEGEYYMTHQVYDSAIRKDIPSITQFRDVLGLHFVINNSPPSIPAQMGWTTENPPEGSDYLNGTDFENYKTCGESLNYSPMTNFWEPSTDDVGVAGYDREVYSPEGTRIYSTTLSTNYQNGGGAVDGTTYWSRTRAIDTAGNYSDWSEKCAITYDVTPPNTGSIIINSDDLYTNDRDVVLDISANDATTDISEMAFSNGGIYSNWEPYATSKNWQLANSDGEKIVRIKFKDTAGNENTSYLASDTIILDREDPISEPTSPSAGYYNADTWDGFIEGTASDDRSGVSKVEVSIKTITPENETKYWDGDSWESNQEWLMATNTTNWSYTTTSLIEGTYTFYSRATDNAGNTESTGELSGIIYDTSSPQLFWTSPTTDTIISGTLVILSTATDNLSGVASIAYSYQRDDGLDTWHDIATKTISPYQVSWDTTGLTLDTYNLKAIATDNAGNFIEAIRKIGVAAVISGETGSTPYFGQIYVSWSTDRPTTAQVVYDTVPHLSADPSLFNYGYTYSTSVFDLGKTTFHETLLTGLNDQTVYYYRFISTGSPTAVSSEMSNRTFSSSGPGSPPSGGGEAAPLLASTPSVLGTSTYHYTPTGSTLPEEGEVLGEETTPTPEPEKSPPSITTPTPRVLGAFTSVSPLYFLGGGLLISLILMLLLFRRE